MAEPDSSASDASVAPPPPPPGFDGVAAGTHQPDAADAADVAQLAAAVAAARLGTSGDEVEAPDASLKSGVFDVAADAMLEIKKELAPGASPYTSAKTFQELNLSDELLKGLLVEMKFEKPSKIQAETLPMILGTPPRHLIAQAHNGSGKTTCFVLGMLSRVDPALRAPQALCLCPTRELAVQNVAVLEKMGKHTGISSRLALKEDFVRGARPASVPPVTEQVVIGTPGTVDNWLQRRTLPGRDMRIVVFDEADEMWAADGHAQTSLSCLKAIRAAQTGLPGFQVLLFSATFSATVWAIAQKIVGAQANTVQVPPEKLSLESIKQVRVECVDSAAKEALLDSRIFGVAAKVGHMIIFVASRNRAQQLHASLSAKGHKCTTLTGGATGAARDLVVREFREGITKVLISTDVLSRGFDHPNVNLVVNFDPAVSQSGQPAPETYMHRIGRCGRYGRRGMAVSLTTGASERRVVDSIAAHFQHPIPAIPYDDVDAFETVLEEAGLL